MNIVPSTGLSPAQKEAVFTLWNNEYSGKIALDTVADFEKYLSGLADIQHFLLLDEAGLVQGWAAIFTHESERWFVIILDSSIHKKGYGRQVLNELKNHENALCGWVTDHSNDKKKNGEYYISPLGFYLKNGFKVLPGIRLELEKLSAVKIKWINA